METSLKKMMEGLSAKQLNLTENEPEEYILTEQDATTAILNTIEALKIHKAWKLAQLGVSGQETLLRLSQIDWENEVNREETLKRANSNKHQNLWHEEQRRLEKEKQQSDYRGLVERCTAEYMFRLMKWSSSNQYDKQLIVNQDNKKFITSICYFLSNDQRFETEFDYSLQKGLLIRGVSGLGKTHIVQCVKENELNPIIILSMLEITDEVKSEGQYEVKMGNNKIVYLDDVGTEEPIVNHFGTKVSFFKQFIESVYLRSKSFNKLIISTNNSFSEIEERYGFRVASRMREMFNVINVTGKDMRTNA